MEPKPELLTLDEVAAYLRVHERTVYRLLRQGLLAGRKVGREWRVHRLDLEAFIRPGSSEVYQTEAPGHETKMTA